MPSEGTVQGIANLPRRGVPEAYGAEGNFTGQNFWARGYFVSTVGTDEETLRKYIRHQKEEDKRIEQLRMF